MSSPSRPSDAARQHTTTGSGAFPQLQIPAVVDGCDECNRTEAKHPIYTVNYHGVEVCAKCLTPMSAKRRQRV